MKGEKVDSQLIDLDRVGPCVYRQLRFFEDDQLSILLFFLVIPSNFFINFKIHKFILYIAMVLEGDLREGCREVWEGFFVRKKK